jgi:Mrp family chromosome partitioning ATPase
MRKEMHTERPSSPGLAPLVLDLATKGYRKLLITSTGRGEGKSWVASEAGRALAQAEQESVLLIDADQFKPGLHRELGVALGRGLCEVLDEVYLFDITREDPMQFGIGDWLEILRAQRRTGDLVIVEDDKRYTVHLVKGAVASISSQGDAADHRLGDLLMKRGLVSGEQRDTALGVHAESGRPLGEIVTSLGWATAEDVADALHSQAGERMVSLLALRMPECRFVETAEAFLPASGGRALETHATNAIDPATYQRLQAYWKGPFLGSQLPSYLTDTSLRHLKVLTAGRRACDLLSPNHLSAFAQLLDRVSRMFDVVILDGPPMSRLGPAATLSGLVDGVLLVVKADGAEVQEIRRASDDLLRAGANVLGVILNGADPMVALEGAARGGRHGL